LSFQDKFCEILSDLYAQTLNYIIGGDINISYLSKNNSQIIDYINSLSAIGCDIIISNHTRFSENCKPSLFDHMYTNLTNKDNCSGVTLCELSDYQPIFFMAKNTKCNLNTKQNSSGA